MASFEVEMPDGAKYQIDAPDNATGADIAQAAHSHHQSQQAAQYGGSNPSTMRKLMGGFEHASDSIGFGAMDAIARMAGSQLPKALQGELERGKAFVDQNGGAATVGQVAGEVLPYLGTGAVTGGMTLLPRALAQAATAMGITPGDLAERAKAAAFAAGGEALGTLGQRVVTGLVTPTAAARRLMSEGVFPTIGQAAGGMAKKFEDIATSIPFVGDAINYGRNAAMREGVAAAQSRGGVQVLPRDAGFAGARANNEYFSREFANRTAPLASRIDAPFLAEVDNALRLNNVGADGARHVYQTIQNAMDNAAASGTGNLTGAEMHQFLQSLRNGSAMRTSRDAYQRDTGMAYRNIYDIVDRNILGAPQDVAAFRQLRGEYANAVPAMRAGESVAAVRKDGLFTPEQLTGSMAANAKQQGNRALLRQGDANQQQLAGDLFQTLGNKYPDSGTTGRYLATRGAIDLVGGGAAHLLGAAAPLAGAAGIMTAMNTPVGRRYMLGGYRPQQAIADALRDLGVSGMGAATGAEANRSMLSNLPESMQ